MEKRCPITDLPSIDVPNSNNRDSYKIEYEGEPLFICLPYFKIWKDNKIFQDNKHIFAGAILNKQLPDDEEKEAYWFTLSESTIKEKLNQIIYPKTPKAKLDNLLKTLHDMQNYYGEKIDFNNKFYTKDFLYKLFFKNFEEFRFFIEALNYQELIDCCIQKGTNCLINYKITLKGLNYIIELMEKGNLSNKCFVAMSFNPKMNKTREAIKEVITCNNYDPILIDERHIDSSKTINDAIIADIKSCKFCIADFTQQNKGVYFESGFAVGLGKSVIYTCHKDSFDETHFDTNHFPHIIYDNDDDLKDKLDKKIKAWIK